ncbi:hypothetical protein B7492_33350 (plasmid) [Bacillus mycoides]|uniref:Uncharacterized protein n=1 Tax=Bacillus mycoides TaxID=1405 RepID=A0A1W6AJA6_BACMY|nr:hypothetical protein B7492_33350 [Bacillus mycoides]
MVCMLERSYSCIKVLLVSIILIKFSFVFPQFSFNIFKFIFCIICLYFFLNAIWKLIKWVIAPIIICFGIIAIMNGKTGVFLSGILEFMKSMFMF